VQFKRSAGIFVAGITFLLAGPLLGFIGTSFGAWSATSNRGSGLSIAFVGLAVLGAVVSITGVILLVVAAHRALVKIDGAAAK
jgi:hypothetical protein